MSLAFCERALASHASDKCGYSPILAENLPQRRIRRLVAFSATSHPCR